ncbi:PAS domain-containing sensor histidine kinase [Hymenobacter sedentarius]|uniref:histidine kinase n=1 Tax=Hymenobacter sedentarius TaxID=1411621 RepID=A0A0U4C8Y5_9BACT|nr:ATP-binding protein [Hymenobacter sedentarius]ALW86760.1 PAS domain-containing sensor histidine kinase [Hymenobacter sedentarius]
MPHDPFARALADILLNQASEFVGVYDVELDWFTQVNPAGYRLLGYPSAQALYDDPDRTLRLRPQGESDADHPTAGHREFEAVLRRQTGDTFWARVELTGFFIEGKLYFLVRISDIDRLHQAEHNLAQSVSRFEAVVANATIGIIVCDGAGAIVSANQMAHQQFGYAEGELAHHKIDQLVPMVPGRRHDRLRASFNAQPSVRAMGAHRGNLQGLRKDGSVFPVEVSLSYFHLDDELYVVSYSVDITQKKEAERELIAQRQRVERLNAELEQKVAERTHALLSTLEQLEQRKDELAKALAAEQELGELKSRFVSMASHEFRTPLTAVLSSAALIEKYPEAGQQAQRQRHLERIRQSVNHLNDILEEFLSVGRIEEGNILARPAELSILELLTSTVADVQALMKPGQAIEQDVDCPETVWLDPSLLRKILVNLLSNALKYSGENARVRVRAHCEAGVLTLTVEDQGVGISAEDQEHLFERFFRARNVTNVPGTGLGLYIIAKYLELMNGTISLHSTLGVGTTVTVTIPYQTHAAE